MVTRHSMRSEKELPREVSSGQLASLFNVTRKTVAAWSAAEIVYRTKYGRFDLARSVQGVIRHHKEAAKRAPSTPGVETGAEARARLARLKADIAEEEYKRGRGDLVDGAEIMKALDKRMTAYWREVRQVPWALASRLSFVDREMAMLIGAELDRCLSNIGHGRPPSEDGPDTAFDTVAEAALLERAGKGMLSADGERMAAEAKARRAANGRSLSR
jgi:phage terminase Nu1 subunit (DNA packaging protein)